MNPTPGPWELDVEACLIGIPVPQSDKNYGNAWIDLHDSYDWYPDIPTEVLEANARLIAAAPEMFALLIELRKFFLQKGTATYMEVAYYSQAVKNIIYKVKGE